MQIIEHIKNPNYPCHICRNLIARDRIRVVLNDWATITFGICYACQTLPESGVVDIILKRQYKAEVMK